jgi:protein involved in polysaccharide export with SLBB domain
MNHILRPLLLTTALLASACGTSALTTTQSVSPTQRTPAGFTAWTDAIPAYVFSPGDKLRVQFQLTPELNEDVTVAPDGTVGLRAAGQVAAAGRTATQLQEDIAQAAGKILIKPIVTVSLTENLGSPVFIGGAVAKPGAYNILGRRGSLEAVQLAGGFSPDARMDEVVLIRRDPKDKPMLRTVDVRGFLEGSDSAATGDVPLAPGDIIFVPRNRISEVDLWIDQFINRLLPFSRSFNYTYNHNAPVL